jgi:hypothetical protein
MGVVPSRHDSRGDTARMRVLVAFEARYRSYRETIATALSELRPGVEVLVVDSDALRAEVERYDPQLVVCDRYEIDGLPRRAAWITLPTDPDSCARVRIGTDSREIAHPSFDELLLVIDEAQSWLRMRGI